MLHFPRRFLSLAAAGLVASAADAAEVKTYDLCVYGGTSAGVIAAVQARKMGKTVVLISPAKHLGGLTSGGLGFTDLGDPRTVGGLSKEFFHRVWLHYQQPGAWTFEPREQFKFQGQHGSGKDDAAQTMNLFEPHVAEEIYGQLIAENAVPVVHARLDLRPGGVTRQGARITGIRTEDGQEFRDAEFIDASYEGDLMAKAGVGYAVGREPNARYGETINGIQAHRPGDLPGVNIDPYLMPGKPESGLLPGVNRNAGGLDGAGDKCIQAYCFRMCLTDVPGNRVMIEKPAGYNEADYEMLFRAVEAGQKDFFKLSLLPNRKTDSNNTFLVSTDYIGRNYEYPDADYATRDKIAKAHEDYQRGLVWTLQNHPRVPPAIRERYAKWGLPKDEFVDSDHWATELYVREARRMVSDFVETEPILAAHRSEHPVGMGSYRIDSHSVQWIVGENGFLHNEGTVGRPIGSYPIDYGCMVPRRAECENLLVPVCVSASHVGYGTIRMEPVFMVLGQSAATAAVLALENHVSVQAVDYGQLAARLAADGQVLKLEPKK